MLCSAAVGRVTMGWLVASSPQQLRVCEQLRMTQRGEHPQPPREARAQGSTGHGRRGTARGPRRGRHSLMLKKSRAFMQRNSCGVICSQPNSWERCRIRTHWLYMRDLCMRYLWGETRQARLEVTASCDVGQDTAPAQRCSGDAGSHGPVCRRGTLSKTPVCHRGVHLGLQGLCDPLPS